MPYGTTLTKADLSPIPAEDLPPGLPGVDARARRMGGRTGADAQAKRATITVAVPRSAAHVAGPRLAMPVTHPPHDRYVLRGPRRHDGARRRARRRRRRRRGGAIVDVVPAAEATGGAHGPQIRTGGTIFPGLIELHNHSSYNAMPLWDVPKPYTNNAQWRGIEPYTRRITKPRPGARPDRRRRPGTRALHRGQGAARRHDLLPGRHPGQRRRADQVLRRADAQPGGARRRPRLPVAGTNIANPDDRRRRAPYLDKLTASSCYLQHLSEGTDATARGWFHRLQIDGDDWAVNDRAVRHPLHGSRRRRPRRARRAVARRWCGPRSATTCSTAAPPTSWPPSRPASPCASARTGRRAARRTCSASSRWRSLASAEHGDVFTSSELVEMVTINPAQGAEVGPPRRFARAGQAGRPVVVDGRDGDPFDQLIEAQRDARSPSSSSAACHVSASAP